MNATDTGTIDAREALDYISGMVAGWDSVLAEFAEHTDDIRVAASSETLGIVIWALRGILDRVAVPEVSDL